MRQRKNELRDNLLHYQKPRVNIQMQRIQRVPYLIQPISDQMQTPQLGINLNSFQGQQEKTYKITNDQEYIPEVICINGSTYIQCNNESRSTKKMNKSKSKNKVPDMNVNCSQCGARQKIASDETSYMCFKCYHHNYNKPIYGRFKCFNCNTTVKYRLAFDGYIKCTYCKTINKPPVQDTRKMDFLENQNPYQKLLA